MTIELVGDKFGVPSPTDTSYLEGAIQSLVEADRAAYDITFVKAERVAQTPISSRRRLAGAPFPSRT